MTIRSLARSYANPYFQGSGAVAPRELAPTGGNVVQLFQALDSFERVQAPPVNRTGGTSNMSGIPEQGWITFDQDQVAGDPNACGTTSLAMVLAHFGLIGGTLADAQKVDRDVRSWGGFSAPNDIEKYAKSLGLESEGYNNSSFGELTRHLDAGRPVMAMIDGGGSPHWVVVLNHGRDANGKEIVTVADPSGGRKRTMTREEFERKWDAPMSGTGGFVNELAGYHNYMQVFDRKALPPARDFDIAYTQAAADGVSDLANGGKQLWNGLKSGDPSQMLSGLFGVAGGLVSGLSAIPGGIGRIVEMGGDKALGWAEKQWKKGGFGYVTGALGYVGGGLLKGLGWATKQAGNVIAKVGNAVGGAITSIGETIADGVKSVGKAFKKLFSW